MSKIIKKDKLYFAGYTIFLRVEEEKGLRFFQIDIKKHRKLIDWIEIPLDKEI